MPATAQFTQELPTQSIHLQNATPFAPARTTWTGPLAHYLHSPFKEQIADHKTGTKDDGGKKPLVDECRARNAQTNKRTMGISWQQPPSERCCATPVLKLERDALSSRDRWLASDNGNRRIIAGGVANEGSLRAGRQGDHQKCARFQRRGAQVMTAPILQLNELNTPIRRCAAQRNERAPRRRLLFAVLARENELAFK